MKSILFLIFNRKYILGIWELRIKIIVSVAISFNLSISQKILGLRITVKYILFF